MNTKNLFSSYVDVCGGINQAAARLNIKPVTVRAIRAGDRNVSVKVAIRIHEDTKGVFNKAAFRPDVWESVNS